MSDKIKALPVVVVFKDKKANIFTAPMLFENEECAIRYFDGMVVKMGSQVTDYDMYLIGHYYDKTGDFFPLSENSKLLIKSGDEYKSKVDIIESCYSTIKFLNEKLENLKKKILDLGGELDE